MNTYQSTSERAVHALADVIEFAKAMAGGLNKGIIAPDSPTFLLSIEQNRALMQRLRDVVGDLDPMFYPYGAANAEIERRAEQRRRHIEKRQRDRLSAAGLTPDRFTLALAR